MTAANGRQVERKMLRPPDSPNLPTTLVIPKEILTAIDWLEWASFWLTNLEPGLTLTSPLEKWVNKSHRIWEWFYLEEEDVIIHVGYDNACLFLREGTSPATRSRKPQYQFSTNLVTTKHIGQGLPCSVGMKTDTAILLLNVGPK